MATCIRSTLDRSGWPSSLSAADGCESATPSTTRSDSARWSGSVSHVDHDRPIAVVHARSESEAAIAADAVRAACTIGDAQPQSESGGRPANRGVADHPSALSLGARRDAGGSEGTMNRSVFHDRRTAGVLLGTEVAKRKLDTSGGAGSASRRCSRRRRSGRRQSALPSM